MTNKPAEELLPCPFCGKPAFIDQNDKGNDEAQCVECSASSRPEHWNTRHQHTPTSVEVPGLDGVAVEALVVATTKYYKNYMLDEADSAENCVCGEQQHKDALAVKYALTALRQPASSGIGWQSIEIAPKDGSAILGYDDGLIRVIAWSSCDDFGKDWIICGQENDKQAIDVVYPECTIFTQIIPTHWMPLPKLPASSGEKSAGLEG